MDFFEKNKYKIIIIYSVIAISIILYVLFVLNINDFLQFIITLPLAIPYVAYLDYEKKKRRKKRIVDLKDYAEKNSFDFYAEPKEDQISIFREFKSTKIISNRNIFFNLLIPKNNNYIQPSIVATRSVHGSGDSTKYYSTQIFLYKLNIELPKFFIQRKSRIDTLVGENRDYVVAKKNKLEVYKFKDKKFPHNKYFFFSEDSNVESVISDEFIELLSTGIKRKKALINIESNGKNLIFYKQWSRHSIELMDFYSNLFRVLKESLIK